VSVTIKVSNVDKVIMGLKNYSNQLPQKIDELLQRLAMIGATRARVDFTAAMYAGTNDVEISVDKVKNGYRINASGQAVLFIEFGTGIINPEHPLSPEFGFSHGTYGQGKGANPNGWVYVGEQGNAGQPIREGVYKTMGNPPARAMYNAATDVRKEIYNIAKEVFSK